MELILKFLKSLAKNNNREWFEKNKGKYLEAKELFEVFVAEQLEQLAKFDKSLIGLEPRKLVFRIYRDVRFSKNKAPYKTNFGAAFSAAGKGLGKPGYYLHIQPGGNSFVAGGLYMPEPGYLSKVRQEIDYNGEALVKIFKNKKFQHLFGDFWQDEKLSRPPKGYSIDHPHIEWLKLKSFVVSSQLPDGVVTDKRFIKTSTDYYKAMKPLHDYLNEAIS